MAMMMLETRLYPFGGFNAVAPVYWASPDTAVQRGANGSRVKWKGLFGWAFHALAKDEPPLAYLVASALPAGLSGPTLVAVEDPGALLWYAAIFRDGAPVEGPERVFDDPDMFDAHLAELARSGEIHHAALSKSLAERLPSLWENATIIEPNLVSPEGAPCFASPFTISQRLRKRLMIALGGASLASVVVLAAWAALSPKTAPTPVLVTVYKAKTTATFAQNCVDALSSEWPRPLNWELVSSGCYDQRLAENTDVPDTATEAGAFRTYRLDNGFNPQNARIIARHDLAQWDAGEYVFDDTTLTLLSPFENPFKYVDGRASDDGTLLARVEQAFVGTVETIRRNPSTGTITIRTATTPQAALERLLTVSGAEVRAIKSTNGSTELSVGPLTVSALKEIAR